MYITILRYTNLLYTWNKYYKALENSKKLTATKKNVSPVLGLSHLLYNVM